MYSTNSYTLITSCDYKNHAFTAGFGAWPVIMSAVRNDDGSPGARLKWNTTIPLDCIISVTVISQYSDDDYTPSTIMQTDEATLSDLRCDATYQFRVSVSVSVRLENITVRTTVNSNILPLRVGGTYT